MTLTAYDQAIWQSTKQFYDAIDRDPLAEVKADPAALFRVSGMEPDPAQEELLRCTDPDVMVLWPRQFAGKSTTVSAIALHTAMTNLGPRGRGSTTLIYSVGQRESIELLRKVKELRYSLLHHHMKNSGRSWRARSVARDISRYKEKLNGSIPPEIAAVSDANTMLDFENGSRIISLPATAKASIGWTVDLLILDEAKLIPDDLFKSASQTQATVKGHRRFALSTPLGQRGWFWETWKKCEEQKMEGKPELFRRFFRTCWECPRLDRDFVEKERQIIGEYWFQQEYECKFLDPVGAIFRGVDIERAMRPPEQPVDEIEVPW